MFSSENFAALHLNLSRVFSYLQYEACGHFNFKMIALCAGGYGSQEEGHRVSGHPTVG
jgi:hypothetical protein